MHILRIHRIPNHRSSRPPTPVVSLPSPSEVPSSAPTPEGQENGLPSYEEVINAEAAPPSYQSLFGQVQEARQNSNNIFDFLKKVILLLLDTIIGTIILAIPVILPLSMIFMGSKYSNDCPAEKFIPIYLIIGGLFGIIKNVQLVIRRSCHDTDLDQTRVTHQSHTHVFNFLLAGWFIAGSIWTYRIYEPEYENEKSPNFCHKTLYMYAFWLVTTIFIIVGLLGLILLCYMVSFVISYFK